MADQEIKIRIEAEGGENLDKLWKKFEQGSASLKEITVLKKEMNAAFRDLPVNTAQYTDYANRLAKINDLQRDVRVQTRAGHEAYFQAGLELRQLALAGLGANTALGKFSASASSAVLNAVQLKQTLVPLGVQMGALGIAGVALGAILIEMAPQIWEIINGATEAEKAFKKWSDRVIETHDNLYELLAVQDVLARKLVEQSVSLALIGSGKTGAGGLLAQLFLGDPKETKAQLDKVSEALTKLFENDLKEQGVESLSALAAAEAAFYQQWMDDLENIGWKYEQLFWLRQRASGGVAGGQVPGTTLGSIATGPVKVTKPEPPDVEVTLAEKFALGASLAGNFTQQMAMGFANSTNVLAQGFVRAFGLGQSLLDQFIASFLGSLAQTGLNFLTGGLFGLLGIRFQHGGIIPEPVVGMGRSGRMYAFGEAGPEYVTPTSSNAIAFGSMQRQMGAMTDAITARDWQLKGTNLVLAYDRANKVLRERRM